LSKIIAIVDEIESIDNLNIVTFKTKTSILKMMSLDINSDILIGNKVQLSCKPSSIAIAKDFSGEISFSNQLKSIIIDIKEGSLLSIVTLGFENFRLESLITTKTLKKMDLKIDDEVSAFIKSSELAVFGSIDV